MWDIEIATGIIKHNDKYLIARRLEPKFLKGKWEFPGGTIEPNETKFETLVREIKEETNLTIKPIKELWSYKDVQEKRTIDIHFIEAEIIGDINIKLDEHDKYHWVDINDWNKFEWTELTYKFAERIFK